MFIEDHIIFKESIPSKQEILEKVKQASGLEDIFLTDSKGKFCIMGHPLFAARQFWIDQEDNKILLTRGWDEPNYLLEITISVLVHLGGTYKGELESWTNEKWENVKSKYSTWPTL